MRFIKTLIKSFGYAFSGIANAVKKERNFRIHIVAAVLVICIGLSIFLSFNNSSITDSSNIKSDSKRRVFSFSKYFFAKAKE